MTDIPKSSNQHASHPTDHTTLRQNDHPLQDHPLQDYQQQNDHQQNEIELDKEGHLVDYTIWTPAIAQQLADTIDVTLTDEHYKILEQVRQFHQQFNHPPSTRPLIKYLMKTLPEMHISNRLLQQMFNTGLVARHVNRIAGLPKPPNCL